MSHRALRRLAPVALLLACGHLAAFVPLPAIGLPSVLRYKFKEGEKLAYESVYRAKIRAKAGGLDIAMDVEQTMDMSWTTLKLHPDGSAELAIRFHRIVVNVDGQPTGKLRIDSAAKDIKDGIPAEPFARMVRKLAGQEIKATVTEQGEFKNVRQPDGVDGDLRELWGLSGLNGNGMEQFLSGGLVLPATGLRKGDSWTRRSETKGPERSVARIDMKYTYEGGEPLARFALKPKISLDAERDMMTVAWNEKKSEGTVLFDVQAGRIADIQLRQALTLTLKMGDTTVPMDIEVQAHLRLKPAEVKRGRDS
ncbi:MAG: hypothetical protein U0793_09315 [Gemmataceae bacterium]